MDNTEDQDNMKSSELTQVALHVKCSTVSIYSKITVGYKLISAQGQILQCI